MESTLVNRVASSGLITINLEKYFPEGQKEIFDISQFLFQGLLLKEKDFRAALKEWNWEVYRKKIVLIQCSTDAIIPMWAYMLISQYLDGVANDVFVGTEKEYVQSYFYRALSMEDWSSYQNARIVIKGCGDLDVPEDAFGRVTFLLKPFAKSIMFGEPCSTVPVFKRTE